MPKPVREYGDMHVELQGRVIEEAADFAASLRTEQTADLVDGRGAGHP
jgi:hypothetical protein